MNPLESSPVSCSRPIIGTSWKMNLTRPQARIYLRTLRRRLAYGVDGRCVFVLPAFTSIAVAEEELAGSEVLYGAQDVHPDASGAHTGDVSAAMLAELGCRIVEVGHSERRRDHGEADDLVRRKVDAILGAAMWPLLCIGESAVELAEGLEEEVVQRQLSIAIGERDAAMLARFIVAYEPWWAIGEGAAAAPLDHVRRLHRFIQNWLRDVAQDAPSPPVLYGGSVDLGNAGSLLSVSEVDGLFVGRAALDPNIFAEIVRATPTATVPHNVSGGA
jgi:triosephosphate isomerase